MRVLNAFGPNRPIPDTSACTQWIREYAVRKRPTQPAWTGHGARAVRLQRRLALGYGIAIGLAICVFPVALYAIHRLAGAIDRLVFEQMRAVEVADRVDHQLTTQYTQLLQWMLTPSEETAAQLAGGDHDVRAAIDEVRAHFAKAPESHALAEFERRYVHL